MGFVSCTPHTRSISASIPANTQVSEPADTATAHNPNRLLEDYTIQHVVSLDADTNPATRAFFEAIENAKTSSIPIESQLAHIQKALELIPHIQVNYKNNAYFGRTPLHHAIHFISIVNALIDAGAHVNATDCSLDTPLHLAAFLESLPVTQLLLKHGARVNCTNADGYTPLRIASKCGFTDIAECLQQHSEA